MKKQEFFLNATALLAQAFAHDKFDVADAAASVAAKLITAAETKWATIDAETPLFDVPESDAEGGDTTPDVSGGGGSETPAGGGENTGGTETPTGGGTTEGSTEGQTETQTEGQNGGETGGTTEGQTEGTGG